MARFGNASCLDRQTEATLCELAVIYHDCQSMSRSSMLYTISVKKIALQKVKRRKKKNYLSLLPAVVFLALSLVLIFKYSPDGLVVISGTSLPTLPLFVFLFSLCLCFIVSFMKNRLQGIIFAFFFLIYSTMSFLKLNSIFFLTLLIALLIIVELFIYKKSDI
jgi:hypothetical protein